MGLVTLLEGQVDFLFLAPLGCREFVFVTGSSQRSGNLLGKLFNGCLILLSAYSQREGLHGLSVPETDNVCVGECLNAFRCSLTHEGVRASLVKEGEEVPEGQSDGLVFASLNIRNLVLLGAIDFGFIKGGGCQNIADQWKNFSRKTGGELGFQCKDIAT